MSSVLLMSLGFMLAAGDGLAPVAKGYSATGGPYSLVVRAGADRPGDPTSWRLLLSDAQTDAPIESAQLELSVYGAAGIPPVTAKASAGGWPGHYLADLKQPVPGRYAAVVSATGAGPAEMLVVDGIQLSALPTPPPSQPTAWLWGGVAALLLLAAGFVRSLRRATVATCLCLLVAGGATAHDTSNLLSDRTPGSQVDLAQELQFALGIRTQPVVVMTFAPPAGVGLAARQSPGVPRSAVVERDGKKMAFVRLTPERFVARELSLGWPGQEDTIAVSSGLQPGERVVVAGAAFLRNGGGLLP